MRKDRFLVGADLEEPPVLVGSRRLIEPIAAVGRHSDRPIQVYINVYGDFYQFCRHYNGKG